MSKRRGGRMNFAVLGKTKLRDIAARGGQTAHASGNAHEWTSEEARAARASALKARHRMLPSRKVNGRYEYLIRMPDGEEKWVTRQRIHQLRREGRLR